MKNSLFVLLFFTLLVSAITLAYKSVSPFLPAERRAQVELAARGVFISSDGAETWEQQKNVINQGNLRRADIYDLTFDPSDARVVYAAASNGLYRYRETEEGQIWENIGIESFQDILVVTSVAISPKDSSILFASTTASRQPSVIWKSTDGGKTFEQVYITSSEREEVVDVIIDFHSPGTVFALTTAGSLLRSARISIVPFNSLSHILHAVNK